MAHSLSIDVAFMRELVYGSAVGDALGVPYEFKSRGSFTCKDMVGYGTHYQPAGTWSDDSSMTVATCDSLVSCGCVDLDDLLARFRAWINDAAYTAGGDVFDYGNTTAKALRQGHGMSGSWDSGNGSLMRIAPLAATDATDEEIRDVSAVTHATEACMRSCVDFVALLKGVRGLSKAEADALVLGGKEPMARADVRSGGYVIDTYNAATWCFATTQSYRDCVIEAVNLGDDTDTTACVAGALAAAFYGMDAIPAEWMDALQGKDVIEAALKGSE